MNLVLNIHVRENVLTKKNIKTQTQEPRITLLTLHITNDFIQKINLYLFNLCFFFEDEIT